MKSNRSNGSSKHRSSTHSNRPGQNTGHSQATRYPPPPPGKKLIFRWSRMDPSTGAVIYARNRPFPMYVDDTPTTLSLQVTARPVAAIPVRPVHAPRPQKPLGTNVVALAPVKPRVAQPVKTAPATTRYQLREDVQDVVGAAAGLARAGARLPSGQSGAMNFAELLGAAVAGAGGARISAGVRNAGSENRALITHGVSKVVMPKAGEFVSECRELAGVFGQEAQKNAGPNGDSVAQIGYSAAEFLMHFLAGAANGAPAGYLTQQALEQPTEENLKLLTGSF